MKLRTTRPTDGATWMKGGVLLARQQPLALAGLFSLMIFSLGVLLWVPYLGGMLISMMLPAMTAGWVEVAAVVQRGQRPTALHLFSPLGTPARRTLLGLGVLHAVLSVTMLELGDLIDPGMSDAWTVFSSGTASDDATQQAINALQLGMMLRAALLMPVVLTFWHAPVIAVRDGAGIGKSLFISATASWRNLGAFVVYGLCWLLADMLMSVVLGGLLSVLGLGQMSIILIMPAALLFSAAFYTSLQGTVDGCIDFEGTGPHASRTSTTG